MTDHVFRPPFGGQDDDERTELPEHERDDDTTIGAGVMGTGTTAVDRGTGTLDGEAQGGDRDEDDLRGVNEGALMGPPAGGAQPYVRAYVDDDDDAALTQG